MFNYKLQSNVINYVIELHVINYYPTLPHSVWSTHSTDVGYSECAVNKDMACYFDVCTPAAP